MNETKLPEGMDFLLANICHLHHSRASKYFATLNLYRGQPPVLRALWVEDGLTQKELAEKMQISPATMTKMLQRMEKAGFIRRQSDLDDLRYSRVFLSEKGRAIQSQVEKVFKKMEAETFVNLSEYDLDQLRRYLHQIRENLLQVTGESPWS